MVCVSSELHTRIWRKGLTLSVGSTSIGIWYVSVQRQTLPMKASLYAPLSPSMSTTVLVSRLERSLPAMVPHTFTLICISLLWSCTSYRACCRFAVMCWFCYVVPRCFFPCCFPPTRTLFSLRLRRALHS